MRVQHDSVVFAYPMDDIFVSGGNRYLRDYGPNSFHMRFPGGAADPTPTLFGSLSFDNGDYLYYDGDLARYYAQMPTREHTWLFSYAATTLSIDALFSTRGTSGGFNYGLELLLVTNLMQCYQMQGDATLPRVTTAAGSHGSAERQYRTLVTVEAIPRSLNDGAPSTVSWGAGAIGTLANDQTFVPTIGKNATAASNYLHGTLSYLCLLCGAVSSSDMAELGAMMMNATSGTAPYPFCWR